jgi:outer membrane protein OmpA-like peptidoglycan-associated protein
MSMTTSKITTALALTGALVLAGCTDGRTNIDDPNYRAQKGALTGALLGGIIGVAKGDSKDERLRGAVVGAALGAAAGGAIGATLDAQAAELRDRLGNPNVTVTNMGSYLLVNLPESVTFATGSADVRADLRADLRSIAANLVSYPNSRIQVQGHTDNTGSAAYNFDLSQRRAMSVLDILVGAGVPATRLSAIGYGEDRPVASNSTESGRAQNRRVEIIITPLVN